MKIKIDSIGYKSKPQNFSEINNRLADIPATEIAFDDFCDLVGESGYAFCVSDFKGNKRCKSEFKSQQLFGLDFDIDVSYDKITKRAESYHLPIALAYETFSSVNMSRFRIVFQTAFPIFDCRVASIIIDALMHIFPECDKACSDVSRIFLGGKRIIQKQDKFISIENLMMVLPEFLKFQDEKHCKSVVEKFCIKHKLYRSGGFAYITQKTTSDTYEFIEGDNFFYFNFTDTPENRKSQHKRIRCYNFNVMNDKCKLYNDFTNDTRCLHHHELFGLACSLNCVERGRKTFLEHISNSQFDHYREKDWESCMHYLTAQEYTPMCCDNFCQYTDVCNHATNPVLTCKTNRNSVVKLKPIRRYSIEESFNDLTEHLSEVLNQPYDGISIINAQTALGKTKAYTDYIKNSNKRFIIAVPTNNLKDEVYERLKNSGVTGLIKTESFQVIERMDNHIGETVRRLNSLGAYTDVIEFINKTADENDMPYLKNYIKPLSEYCNSKNSIIVTTHKKLLNNNSDVIKDYEIIIDEDILSNNLRSFTAVSIDDLRKLIKEEKVENFFNEYFNSRSRYIKTYATNSYLSYKKMMELGISTNVNSFMSATALYVEGDKVYCFTPPKLIKSKYTILSATANEEVYRYLFPAISIRFYKCIEAKNKGKLIQDCTRSYSRADIDTDVDFFENIKKENPDASCIITFEKYKDVVNNCPLHFGNTEGLDFLKGQNIVVVGTPHANEKVYKLIACHIGAPTEEKMQFQEVVDEEHKYWLNTYENKILRNLQLYFLKSDLIQAVGRARLLRNDCTVKLYSSIPLPQAIIE